MILLMKQERYVLTNFQFGYLLYYSLSRRFFFLRIEQCSLRRDNVDNVAQYKY